MTEAGRDGGETKEDSPRQENQTLATITIRLLRMFKKLAGMTGTAVTEAGEFLKICRRHQIPTNMPMVRLDQDDTVFRTGRKGTAITEIARCTRRGPVLVGTTSVEKSE
jgi:preprotein translocase subunit SecA